MYQKDYLMRMLQEFSRMIARIIGLKEKGDYHEALKMIDGVYSEVLKINPAEALDYDTGQWEEFYQAKPVNEWEMLAELLRIEGETLLEMNKPEGVCKKLILSLDLLKKVNEAEKSFSLDRMGKIAELEDKLAGINPDN